MNRRLEVVEMLRAGVSATRIARELGVSVRTVHRTRQELGLPKSPPGPRPPEGSLEEVFLSRTRLLEGGHREWLGVTRQGMPVMRWEGRKRSVRQVAFLLHSGRKAIGHVLPGCGESWCVEPSHQGDAQFRADLDALCLAVFGEAL